MSSIEFDSSFINENQVYSKNEIKVGKWINGKTIYRKVIDFGKLPDNAAKQINHGISNIDEVTNYWGMYTNGYNYGLLPYVVAQKGYIETAQVSLDVSLDNITVYTSSNIVKDHSAIVIIEYTKK